MWFLTKEKKEELCKQRDAKVCFILLFTILISNPEANLSFKPPVIWQLTELNTLKKKSPSDLWKADLAAFSEELEV